MNGSEQFEQRDPLYSADRYKDNFFPEHILFNANLQEFARRVEVICSLETEGQITLHSAYEQIHQLYQQLKKSRESWGIKG